MKLMIYCLCVSVVVVLCLVGDIHAAAQDVCIGYEFSASCGLSEVLVMETAEFGRMSPGRCITAERGYTVGCTNDVLNLADRWCSGLDKCNFDVTNKDLEEANTNCNKNLKAYFLATYTCVRVESPSQSCKSGIAPSTLTNVRGTISSHTSTNSRCGSARAPWRIEAQVGQTIKISLVDFQALYREGSRTSLSCVHVYGFILERALNINQTVCGQKQRESLLYTSKTNTVEIYLHNDGDVRFLLEYEVSGCAEITPPPGGWYKRNGNEAVIGCEKNGQEWKLKCEGSTWQGSLGNCSQPVIAASVAKPALGLTLPSGKIQYKVIAVTGMIGATVVIAIAVVVFGVVYIKKYRDQKERSYVRSKKGQEEKAFALVPAATSALNTNYRPLSGVSTASMYLQPTLPLQTVDLVPVESEQQKQQQQQQKAQQQQQQQSQQQQQQEQQTKVKTPDSLLLEMMKIEESGDQVEGATTTCAHEATSFTRGQQQEGVTGTTYPIPGHKYYVLEQGFA